MHGTPSSALISAHDNAAVAGGVYRCFQLAGGGRLLKKHMYRWQAVSGKLANMVLASMWGAQQARLLQPCGVGAVVLASTVFPFGRAVGLHLL